MKGRTTGPSLRLDVDPELMQGWLPARLPALMRTLDGTTLTVLSAPRHDRDAFDHVDVALRYGYGEWEGVDSALVCPDRLTAMAAPALLERYGLTAPLTPEQVLELPLLGYTKRSWIPWLEAAELEPVEPDTIAVFDNAAAVATLASASAPGWCAGCSPPMRAATAGSSNSARSRFRRTTTCTRSGRASAMRASPLVDAIGTLVAQSLAC